MNQAPGVHYHVIVLKSVIGVPGSHCFVAILGPQGDTELVRHVTPAPAPPRLRSLRLNRSVLSPPVSIVLDRAT